MLMNMASIIKLEYYQNSDIFKEHQFQIEIKLPLDSPKIRFIIPIYNGNVRENKETETFCLFWQPWRQGWRSKF